MARVTVTETVTVAGVPVTDCAITCTLHPSTIDAVDPLGNPVLGMVLAHSDATGLWTASLERTDTMSPAGMTWSIRRRSYSANVLDTRYVEVLAGGVVGSSSVPIVAPSDVPAGVVVGPPGPPGPPGSSSGDVTTTFTQGSAATTWTINHNLNRYPSVTVVDGSGNKIIGDVQYVTSNQIVLTFGSATSGTAYLN